MFSQDELGQLHGRTLRGVVGVRGGGVSRLLSSWSTLEVLQLTDDHNCRAGGQDSQILLSTDHPSAPLSALLSTRYLLKTSDPIPVYIQVQTRGWRTGPKEVLQRLSDAAKEGSTVTLPSPDEYKFRLTIEFTVRLLFYAL